MQNNLFLNGDKSVEVLFSLKHDLDLDSVKKIEVNNCVITPQKSGKYLGLTFDTNLKFDIQMQVASKKSARLLYFAVRLARNCKNHVIIAEFVDVFLISQLTYFLPVIYNFVKQKEKNDLHRQLRHISRLSRRQACYFSELVEKRIESIASKIVKTVQNDPSHPLFLKFKIEKNNKTRNGIILPKKRTEKAKKTLSYLLLNRRN